MRALSARALLTVFAMLIAAFVLFLLVAVVRQSLIGTHATVIEDATTAAWTVGVLLIGLAGLAGWMLATYLFEPVAELSRNVTLAARSRALSDAHVTEVAELRALRETLLWVLRELEEGARGSENAKRHVLGLFEATSEGIVQVGADARFVHVNRAGRLLLRLPGNPEGQSAASLIRHSELRDIIDRAARGDDVKPAEIVLDNRQLLIAPRSLLSEGSAHGGAIITIVDLTELRRLEGVRRDFVANVSHELKTPLTSIRGYSETLISDDMSREEQLKFLEVIHKNATRLQRIVEELLDLSRLESGGWAPNMQRVALKQLATEAWSGCETMARQKQITLTIAGPETEIAADPEALQQVFTNIYENAVRHTPDQGSVSVTIIENADTVSVDVRDTGTGIAAQALPRIFERFYRVDASRSRSDGGTGLGLAIVKHLMERMNGSVTAQSAPGAGTTISLQLPK